MAAAPAAAAAAAEMMQGDESVSVSLVILNGFLVFFMQVGFIALETGSGRAKNVRNVLLKNLLDVMLAALAWWAVGYAFAYGASAGGVIGTSGFFFEGAGGGVALGQQQQHPVAEGRPWFLSFTFAVACCVIVSGCLAERTRLLVYPSYTVLLAAVAHPVVVHWLWGSGSWLNSAVSGCHALDFAGGLAVHAVGGLFGLVGAACCGPRLGRFDDADGGGNDGGGGDGGDDYDGSVGGGGGGGGGGGSTSDNGAGSGGADNGAGSANVGAASAGAGGGGGGWRKRGRRSGGGNGNGNGGGGWGLSMPKELPGHDMAFVTLGTFMLWFGWYGFNSGSVYVYRPSAPPSAVGVVAMNTTLAASTAGLASLLVAALWAGTYDLRVCCNGVLSGLVIVTPMCGFVDPWAAAVCGLIAGVVYPFSSALLVKARIDDPLDSSAVHLVNGVLGTLLLGLVAKPARVQLLTGTTCGGVFYEAGWTQLGMQALATALTLAFAGALACALFLLLRHYNLLRVDQLTELAGIDNLEHGGPAYPERDGALFVAMATLNGGGGGGGTRGGAGALH